MADKGIAYASIAIGAIFLYAGVKGKSIPQSFQSVLTGKSPTQVGAANTIQGTAPVQGYDIATNIPAAKGSYSRSGLEKLWTDNGGPSDTAAFAAAVAEAESEGNPKATSRNPDGGTNVGIFQLDTKGVGSGYPVADLQDPNLNTQITIMATNGGTNWQAWGDPVTAAVGYHYTPGSAVP